MNDKFSNQQLIQKKKINKTKKKIQQWNPPRKPPHKSSEECRLYLDAATFDNTNDTNFFSLTYQYGLIVLKPENLQIFRTTVEYTFHSHRSM